MSDDPDHLENCWQAFCDNPVNIRKRAVACQSVRHDEAFLTLCGAAKRIRNILSKSADSPVSLGSHFRTDLFKEEAEKVLGQEIKDADIVARIPESGQALPWAGYRDRIQRHHGGAATVRFSRG